MNPLEKLEAKSKQITSKKKKQNLIVCYARVMSEFNVQYSEFKTMPLPFFIQLLELISKQDAEQKKANKKR